MIKYFFPEFSFFHALCASVTTSIIITFWLCKIIINISNKKKLVDIVRDDLNLKHQENKNVPSFGGVAMIIATITASLLFADLTNIYVQLLLLTIIMAGGVGFIDDYLKIFKRSKKGIRPIIKLIVQGLLGGIICINMLKNKNIDIIIPENFSVISLQKVYESSRELLTQIPFTKNIVLDYNTDTVLGIFGTIIFIIILTFIISGTSNAVNFTDGIDELALKNSALTIVVLIFYSALHGQKMLAFFFNTIYIPGIEQSIIISLALFVSCLTCLWFNIFPAKIFIGDSGSLMLGSFIAVLAIFLRIELFLPILCGVFFVETLSVIVQVFYFKYTKKKYGQGKKIFLLSPIHYHLIKKGWKETQTCSRLTLISILLTVFSLFLLFF